MRASRTAQSAGRKARQIDCEGHAKNRAGGGCMRPRVLVGQVGRAPTSMYLVISFFSKSSPDLVETTGSVGTSPLSAQTSADILSPRSCCVALPRFPLTLDNKDSEHLHPITHPVICKTQNEDYISLFPYFSKRSIVNFKFGFELLKLPLEVIRL